MIVVNMTFAARPGCSEAFSRALVEMMQATTVEDGCIIYRYTRDLEDPQVFHLVELWESPEKMQVHIDAPHSASFVEKLGSLADFRAVRAYEGEMNKFRVPSPRK